MLEHVAVDLDVIQLQNTIEGDLGKPATMCNLVYEMVESYECSQLLLFCFG